MEVVKEQWQNIFTARASLHIVSILVLMEVVKEL